MRRTGLLLAAVAAAALLALAASHGAASPSSATSEPSWRTVLGVQRPQAAVGQRMLVVLRAPSLADRVRAAGGRASDRQEREWTAAALAVQKQLITNLAAHGVQVLAEFSYARVLNGFSAPLDARAVALLERTPGVEGVYPVRAAYPASVAARILERRAVARITRDSPPVSLAGFDGAGVTIALLDTGVEESHPFLRGRVGRGSDILGEDDSPRAAAKPDDPSVRERHGTEMAGILVGASGRLRLGAAPGASLLPIRVAGWQQEVTGTWSVYARTDQLIAGLERAVDPNADGDAHDGARVALVSVAEPYAAFADGPVADAVSGALGLDTLVVAPAGNDGAAGPSYGSVAGPGGASAALSVGAVDPRRHVARARVALRVGLDLELDGVLPLAGAIGARRPLNVEVAAPRRASRAPGIEAEAEPLGAPLADFFDRAGFSLVAGRAALVPAGRSPGLAVENAVRAGAAAVLLYGGAPPGGSLGLSPGGAAPALSIPASAARAVLRGLKGGRSAVVSIEDAGSVRNQRGRRVAPFSSRGLAFGGRAKPELIAPGVVVPTAEPGAAVDGSARLATVNGSSAAAAAVAGAAALLAQARPDLDAVALKSLLVGSARRLPRDAPAAQGAGLLDVGAAAAAEVAVDPAALAFGRARGRRWRARRTLRLHNVSTRTLRVSLSLGERLRRGVRLSVTPRRLTLSPGRTTQVTLRAELARRRAGTGAATGFLRVAPSGGRAVPVPWAAVLGPAPGALVGPLRLSAASFRPSDTAPAVLTFQAGRVVRSGSGAQIAPVALLNVELWAAGKRLGVLARLRNLLPGRYAIGLTGRDPRGRRLRAGRYALRLVAFPPDSGRPSRKSIAFAIE